jgi:hypothetical protein
MNRVNITANAMKVFARLPGLKSGTLSEQKTDSQGKFKVVSQSCYTCKCDLKLYS